MITDLTFEPFDEDDDSLDYLIFEDVTKEKLDRDDWDNDEDDDEDDDEEED